MKKVLMLVMTLCAAITMNAQNEEGEATLQVKGGMNIATLAGDADAKWKISYAAGLEFEYGLTEQFGLVGGILYSDQGEKDDKNNMKLNLGYVNVPLMVQFYPVKGLALKTGVQLGFLASKKAKIDGNKVDFDKLEAMGIIPSEFRKFDLAIPMGISYEYERFVLDARYNLGLLGIFKETAGYDTFRNSVFQITLGYKIPFNN